MEKTCVFKKIHEGVQKCACGLLQEVVDSERFGTLLSCCHVVMLCVCHSSKNKHPLPHTQKSVVPRLAVVKDTLQNQVKSNKDGQEMCRLIESFNKSESWQS